MKPLHDSMDPQALRKIRPGDTVSFRMVNDEHCSGIVESVSPRGDAFTFAGRGFCIHAIEIARIESHRSRGAR